MIDELSPVPHHPGSLGRKNNTLVVVLAIGLVPALIFAWA